MILLALKWWRESLIAILILFAVVMWKKHNSALIERGRALEQVRVADSALAVLRPALARVDTQLVHDTTRVQQTLYRFIHDTITAWRRDTIYAASDTAKAHPGVVIPTETLARYDTLASQCADLEHSCSLFRQTATATIAALEAKVRAVPIAVPRSCVSTGAVWSLIGAGVGFAGGKIGR